MTKKLYERQPPEAFALYSKLLEVGQVSYNENCLAGQLYKYQAQETAKNLIDGLKKFLKSYETMADNNIFKRKILSKEEEILISHLYILFFNPLNKKLIKEFYTLYYPDFFGPSSTNKYISTSALCTAILGICCIIIGIQILAPILLPALLAIIPICGVALFVGLAIIFPPLTPIEKLANNIHTFYAQPEHEKAIYADTLPLLANIEPF